MQIRAGWCNANPPTRDSTARGEIGKPPDCASLAVRADHSTRVTGVRPPSLAAEPGPRRGLTSVPPSEFNSLPVHMRMLTSSTRFEKMKKDLVRICESSGCQDGSDDELPEQKLIQAHHQLAEL